MFLCITATLCLGFSLLSSNVLLLFCIRKKACGVWWGHGYFFLLSLQFYLKYEFAIWPMQRTTRKAVIGLGVFSRVHLLIWYLKKSQVTLIHPSLLRLKKKFHRIYAKWQLNQSVLQFCVICQRLINTHIRPLIMQNI